MFLNVPPRGAIVGWAHGAIRYSVDEAAARKLSLGLVLIEQPKSVLVVALHHHFSRGPRGFQEHLHQLLLGSLSTLRSL